MAVRVPNRATEEEELVSSDELPQNRPQTADGSAATLSASSDLDELFDLTRMDDTDLDAGRRASPGTRDSGGSNRLFEFKQSVQNELLRRVNKHKQSFEGLNDADFRSRVREIVVAILSEPTTKKPEGWSQEALLTELLHDFLGLGPLEDFLADDTISEVEIIFLIKPTVMHRNHHVRHSGGVTATPSERELSLQTPSLLAALTRKV